MKPNPRQQLQGTWLAMIALQSIGTIDVKHRLPAPRQFVAIAVLWGTLFLLADMGYARFAARFSMLVLLIGGVIGPFGLRLMAFFETVALRFQQGGDSTSPQAGAGGSGLSSSQGAAAPIGTPAPAATSMNI